MNNKDKYKKEMKSIKPSRGLVEDTINMIKDNKLEKKNFWSVYKKPMVAFAASFGYFHRSFQDRQSHPSSFAFVLLEYLHC